MVHTVFWNHIGVPWVPSTLTRVSFAAVSMYFHVATLSPKPRFPDPKLKAGFHERVPLHVPGLRARGYFVAWLHMHHFD